MFSAAERITQAPACKVIELSEAEKRLYTDSGWKLAHFLDGIMIELHDPRDVPYVANTQSTINEAIKRATVWLNTALPRGEVWIVRFSCCQLCEPRQITHDDPTSFAHMARVIDDELREDFE